MPVTPPAGASHLNLTLALLSSAGGVAGYAKKGSVPSLVGGLACGAAFAGSAYIINTSDDVQKGFLVGAAGGTLMLGAMLPRLIQTKKVMPAGVGTVLGAAALGYNAYQAQKWS